jgi:hypothetical protein
MSIKSYLRKVRGFAKDKGGAALPEFAVAIFPLLWLFFVFVQVAQCFIGHLVLHHAAVIAARCAVVDKGPNLPGKYVDSDAETACKNAAIAGVGKGFWFRTIWNISVAMEFTGGNDHIAQYSDVTTTTSGEYKCTVPLGQRIICNGSNKKWAFAIKLPHEGAMYTLDNDYNGS